MLKTMIKVVKEASEIMLSAQDIENNTEKKGDKNFVTIYDKKVQAYIRTHLNETYPDIKYQNHLDYILLLYL